MTKNTKLAMYIGGGAAVAGLVYYAWKKAQANPEILTASLPGTEDPADYQEAVVVESKPIAVQAAAPKPATTTTTVKAMEPTVKPITTVQAQPIIQAAPLMPSQPVIAQPIPVPQPAPIPSYISPTVAIQPAPAPSPVLTTTYKAPTTTYTQPVTYSQPVVYSAPKVYSGGTSTGTASNTEQMKGLNGFLLI